MWQEEKFLLRLTGDSSHYLLCLSAGMAYFLLKETHYFQRSTGNKALNSIAIIFLIALLFAFHVEPILFIISVVFLFSILIAFKSPISSVGLTIILYVCRPWEVVETSEWWQQLPRWCIWIWITSWMRQLFQNNMSLGTSLKFTRGIVLILCMASWALLTTIFSGDPSSSLQYFVDTLFRAIILVLIIQLTVQNADHAVRLQTAFGVGIVTLSMFSLWRYYGNDQHAPLDLIPKQASDLQRRLEAVGSLGNSNDIAAVVMIALGILWPSLLSRDTSLLDRVVAILLICLLLKTILASQSRGALIAAVAQCGIYFVSKSRSPKFMGALLLLSVAVVAPLASKVMGRHTDDLDASTESRMNYYVTGLRMTIQSPIWGQGFGRYPYEFENFSTATLHEWGLRTAHSSWVLVASETGLVGLILFAWIHIRMFRQCWFLKRSDPGFLLALTGYTITILFLSHSWLMFPWILFALIELKMKFNEKELLDEIEERRNSRNKNSLDCSANSLAPTLRS